MSATPEQFEALFNRSYRAVHAYAARRVPPEAVQDVVSETFLIAWRRRAELDEQALPWLLAVARRVAANHRRADARRGALQERLRSEPSSSEQSTAGGRDPALASALARLAERDREALMLVAWEQLDHRAAAKAMGCSTGAFTVRLHRARRKLAHALAAQQPNTIELPQEVSSSL